MKQSNLSYFLQERLKQRTMLKPVGYLIILIGLYLFFLLFVRPEFIYFVQQPSFFVDHSFLEQHLQLPGGLLDILAAFLTDLFQIGWLGAFILITLIAIVYLLLQKIFQPHNWWIAPLIPTIVLLLTHMNLEFPIVKTLSLILALEGFILYRDVFPTTWSIRFSINIVFMVCLYILSPGAMLLYTLLCVLNDILGGTERLRFRSSIVLGYLGFAALIPWFAERTVFLIPLENAYLRHAPLWYGDVSSTSPAFNIPFDAILCGLIVVLVGLTFVRIEKLVLNIRTSLIHSIQVAIAVLSISVGLWFTADRNVFDFMSVRFYAHTGDWTNVIEHVNENTIQNELCLFHYNRALFHSGQLASKFFTISQNMWNQSLFLDKDYHFQALLDCSDFYYELGHINEAKRWASEALTFYGESSDVLKRLALVNLLMDDFKAASLYLKRLAQNPISSSWAQHYLAVIADPEQLRKEKELQELHARMPQRDFLVMSNNPEMDLKNILEQAPRNRMAFEYLMMTHLIKRNVTNFIQDLVRYRNFSSASFPRHYEEALMLHFSQKASPDSVAASVGIQKETIEQFNDLKRRYAEHRGNNETAYADLQPRYGNTYWFYVLFIKPTSS